MRRIAIGFLYFFFAFTCFTQQFAITETGEKVILYEDGTWEYVSKLDQADSEIKTNPKKFEKSNQSTFLLKSIKMNTGFWINPKKWSFNKAKNNPSAEYEFQLKGNDLYGVIITEQIEVPLASLKTLALQNGRIAAPDTHVVKEEYRIVNGLKVLFLQLNGTIEGIKFSYYGYYFTNSTGTCQFLAYTSQSLLEKYLADIEELLNGLVEVEESPGR
ncbi:MAG: hypothetical protein JXB88_15080 [Spirochaetales bacterium]|nr:hypothetical protein [Spirochaetales bacterium]